MFPPKPSHVSTPFPYSYWSRARAVAHRIIPAVLGLLLLSAAVLKLRGQPDSALEQNMILFSPRVRFAAVEAEALLGLWLLAGWARRAAWFVALVFFLVLAATSLYLGLIGQSSCDCFGRIHVSPWAALLLDLVCLVALTLCCPPLCAAEAPADGRWRREALTIAAGAGALLTVGLGAVLLAADSPGAVLARLRGEVLFVDPIVSDLGSAVPGQTHNFMVHVHNRSDRTVKILGGTSTCSCVTTEDLPVAVPPRSSVPVSVRARFGGTTGMFQSQFVFYTDDEHQNRLLARFEGRVLEPPDP
jgi:hypothetical protein